MGQLEKKDYEYLFKSCRSGNKAISRQQAYKILSAAGRKFNIDKVGTHTLRKTFGYHMYQQTHDAVTIKEILNHADISVTLRYIGINQDKLTGIKGTEFTAKYINRFHEMEDVIQTQLPSGNNLIALAVIEAQKMLEQKDKQIEEMKPKAEFFDAVADSKTAISMNEVAKVLSIKGYGRNNLFEFLRNEGILDRFNVPYQRYVDCGWFRVIEQKYMKNGEQQISTKTLVYQKGVDAIRRKILDK